MVQLKLGRFVVMSVAWGEAATRHDVDAVVAYYAPDGSLVWPGMKAVHGIKAIHAAWKTMVEQTPGLGLNFKPERIVVSASGDLASDFGVVEFTHDTAKGSSTEIGKYLVVWRKEKGAWKVLYDSYNMNAS